MYTLKRRHATLACKEGKERQTQQLLGKLITEIHQDISIHAKVAATTTDNGANYVAAFNDFDEANHDQEDLRVDPEDADLQVVDLQVRLMAEGNNPSLPPHLRSPTQSICWRQQILEISRAGASGGQSGV